MIDRTISDAISRHAVGTPERPAIVCSGLAALSFQDLDRTIKQIGVRLQTAGIGASSRVGIMMPNGPEAALIALAVSAHAIGFPLNPALTASEFEFELKRADLDAIVLPEWVNLPITDTARAAHVGIFHATKANSSLAEVDLRSVAEIAIERRRSGTPSSCSVSVIQMSSGSTGIPKLILVSHENLFDIAQKMHKWFGLSADDRCACTLPVFSGFGFKIALVAPLLIGSSIALARTQRPEDIGDWISDLGPTWFVSTPTYLHAALDKLRSTGDRKTAHSLRFFASTSAYLPEAVRVGLEDILGIPCLEFYGLREAGIVTANPAPPAIRKPGSVGLVSPDVTILGSDSQISGISGVLAVRGAGVSPGYIEALPLGSDTVPKMGRPRAEWTLTGDLGIVDENGFLSIHGRAKEIINRGGEKISPYEIEKALLQHPSVREAGVYSVPHPRLGENVAAAVVLQPHAETTSSELRDFLRSHLAGFKIPQRIEAVDSIPKSNNGKILRAHLAEIGAARNRQIDPPESPLEFQILAIWQRLLQHTDIGVRDDFFEAGGDSLLATEMLAEVEVAIGHRIPQAELVSASTIRELATIASEIGSDDDDVVTKTRGGTGTPFVFCHGDVTTRGFYALKLAALLKSDGPVYLVHPRRDVNKTSELAIEDMAAFAVRRLLAFQPSGSFLIGGYCTGGLLAWEVAHQLLQAGRQVETVLLIDTLSLNSRWPFRAARRLTDGIAGVAWSKAWKRRLNRSAMPALWVLARETYTNGLQWMAQSLPAKPLFDERDVPYFRAMANYIPPTLDCELVAIACQKNANAFEWSTGAWVPLVRHVRQAIVPGEHMTCITTHVEALANLMNTYLSVNMRE
jgi:oxalate---CoA ligase